MTRAMKRRDTRLSVLALAVVSELALLSAGAVAPAAAQRLHDATTNHSGLRIAFMADDDVLLNVVWEGPYGVDTDGTQVSLEHGMKRARRLMEAIRGCTGASG